MVRDTHFVAIGHVATMIGENIELLEEIAANSDNTDYGELVYVTTGPDVGMKAFTSRGIESLQEFLADVRSWQGLASASSSSTKIVSPMPSNASARQSQGNNRAVTQKQVQIGGALPTILAWAFTRCGVIRSQPRRVGRLAATSSE